MKVTDWMWKRLRMAFPERLVECVCCDALFVVSYGIDRTGIRLTNLSQQALEETIELTKSKNLTFNCRIILSHAYLGISDVAKKLKIEYLFDRGLSSKYDVFHISMREKANSLVEAQELLRFANLREYGVLAVVGERTHLPRLLWSVLTRDPKIKLLPIPFDGNCFEPHKSIPWLKGFSNHRLMWLPWNLLGFLLTTRF